MSVFIHCVHCSGVEPLNDIYLHRSLKESYFHRLFLRRGVLAGLNISITQFPITPLRVSEKINYSWKAYRKTFPM